MKVATINALMKGKLMGRGVESSLMCSMFSCMMSPKASSIEVFFSFCLEVSQLKGTHHHQKLYYIKVKFYCSNVCFKITFMFLSFCSFIHITIVIQVLQVSHGCGIMKVPTWEGLVVFMWIATNNVMN